MTFSRALKWSIVGSVWAYSQAFSAWTLQSWERRYDPAVNYQHCNLRYCLFLCTCHEFLGHWVAICEYFAQRQITREIKSEVGTRVAPLLHRPIGNEVDPHSRHVTSPLPLGVMLIGQPEKQTTSTPEKTRETWNGMDGHDSSRRDGMEMLEWCPIATTW